MSDHETLFRLLAGELAPDEAATLRARLAAELRLRAAWVDVLRTEADLVGMTPAAVPALLLDTVAPEPPASRRPWGRGVAALALAATLLLVPTLLIQRHLTPPPEEAMQWRRTALGAAAGAAVTISVYEGRAVVQVDDGPPREIAPGEALTVAPRPALRPPSPSTRTAASPRAAPTEEADARVEALELENAMLRGQIELLGGVRAEWPPDVAPMFRAEVMRSWLEEATTGLEAVSLETVECGEFPCMAVFRYDPELSASTEHIRPLWQDFRERAGDDAFLHTYLDGSGGAATAYVAFGPPDTARDALVRSRIETRMDELKEQYADAP